MPLYMEQTGRASGGEVRVLRAPKMELKEYVESFGWKLEDLTPQEIREVKKELRARNKGMTVLDGVLFWKDRMPGSSCPPCP